MSGEDGSVAKITLAVTFAEQQSPENSLEKKAWSKDAQGRREIPDIRYSKGMSFGGDCLPWTILSPEVSVLKQPNLALTPRFIYAVFSETPLFRQTQPDSRLT